MLELRYLVLQDIKYCIVPDSYGIYLAAQQQNRSYKYPVCANVGVLLSLIDILSQACLKLDFLFSNFGFGVLHNHVMFWCIERYLTKTEPGIRFH